MILKTSDDTLDELYDLINKTRLKTETLAVNKITLFNLLSDHRHMWGKLKEYGEVS